MNYREFVARIRAILTDLVTGTIDGAQAVRAIDGLMADDLPDVVPSNIQEVLNQLHEDLSFYVEDEEERKEHRAYYGLTELKQKAAEYSNRLCLASDGTGISGC